MSRLSDDAAVLAEAATLLTTPLNLPAAIAGVAVTDPSAMTQAAVTDSLNGATFTGTALSTSATPLVDELEAAFGVVGLQLNRARTDIAVLRTKLIALIASLEGAGLIAS